MVSLITNLLFRYGHQSMLVCVLFQIFLSIRHYALQVGRSFHFTLYIYLFCNHTIFACSPFKNDSHWRKKWFKIILVLAYDGISSTSKTAMTEIALCVTQNKRCLYQGHHFSTAETAQAKSSSCTSEFPYTPQTKICWDSSVV